MKKTILLLIVTPLIFDSCAKSKNPGLSDKELFLQQDSIELQELYSSEIIVDSVTPGVRYKESKANDPAISPVVLNYSDRKLNMKAFNPADYYSKARYVKLKYPNAEAEFGFNQEGKMMLSGIDDFSKLNFDSNYLLADNYIVAGNLLSGLHCYDREGNFKYTIEATKFSYNAKKEKDVTSIDGDLSDLSGFTGNLSIHKNICIYSVRKGKDYFIYFHNLENQKTYSKQKYSGGNLVLIDPKTYGVYNYSPIYSTDYFFQTLDIKGDTLCRFSNTIPQVEVKGNYTNPDNCFLYQQHEKNFLRQSYNDTVYLVQSEKWISPSYILNFGSSRLDAQTGIKGDKSGKFIPYRWIYADQYILFIYTENYDCPNNRDNGRVKFFYSYYDKKNHTIYHLPSENLFPEKLVIDNSVDSGIPFTINRMKSQGNQLIITYSKSELSKIIQQKDFAKFTNDQQTRIKEMYDQITPNDIWMMILDS